MKKILFLALLFLLLIQSGSAQKTSIVKFDFKYINISKGIIELMARNSAKATVYYTIGMQGYKDTVWVPLLSDINALGKNEFVALKAFAPQSVIRKTVSLRQIRSIYKGQGFEKVRFDIMIYRKKDFHSDGWVIYSKDFYL